MTPKAKAKVLFGKIVSTLDMMALSIAETDTCVALISKAMAEARREGLEEAAHHHQPGCPTIADDDSDSVLDDYMECCCEKDELRIWCRAQAQGGGDE